MLNLELLKWRSIKTYQREVKIGKGIKIAERLCSNVHITVQWDDLKTNAVSNGGNMYSTVRTIKHTLTIEVYKSNFQTFKVAYLFFADH